jgi:hypothetical protein
MPGKSNVVDLPTRQRHIAMHVAAFDEAMTAALETICPRTAALADGWSGQLKVGSRHIEARTLRVYLESRIKRVRSFLVARAEADDSKLYLFDPENLDAYVWLLEAAAEAFAEGEKP